MVIKFKLCFHTCFLTLYFVCFFAIILFKQIVYWQKINKNKSNIFKMGFTEESLKSFKKNNQIFNIVNICGAYLYSLEFTAGITFLGHQFQIFIVSNENKLIFKNDSLIIFAIQHLIKEICLPVF